jgi:two-component system response regulator
VLTLRVLRHARIANEVIVLRDGVEALDYLLGVARDATPVPVCVLLDLTLPRVNGLEIFDRLRMDHRTTRLPVLMLVADADYGNRLCAAQLGTCRAVRKPLEIAEFITASREIGLSWMVVGEAAATHAPTSGDQETGAGTRCASMPTRLTTGDRCPACNAHDIERLTRSGRSATEDWRCRACAAVFLRLVRDAMWPSTGERQGPRPIAGGSAGCSTAAVADTPTLAIPS